MEKADFGRKIAEKNFRQLEEREMNYDHSAEINGAENEVVKQIPIEKLKINVFQFRKLIRGIDELAEDIKQHGIIQPLIVTKQGDQFLIVCGARRYHAAKKAGLKKIPCIVKTAEQVSIDEWNFVENVQRKNLTALEIYCAICEFHRRGYKAARIMQMTGDKDKSKISKSIAIGEMAGNLISAEFVKYEELSDMMEKIGLNTLYAVARLARKDIALGFETLKYIYDNKLNTSDASNYIAYNIQSNNITFETSKDEPEVELDEVAQYFKDKTTPESFLKAVFSPEFYKDLKPTESIEAKQQEDVKIQPEVTIPSHYNNADVKTQAEADLEIEVHDFNVSEQEHPVMAEKTEATDIIDGTKGSEIGEGKENHAADLQDVSEDQQVIKQNPPQKVDAQFVYTEVKIKDLLKDCYNIVKQTEKVPNAVVLLDAEKKKVYSQKIEYFINNDLDVLKKNMIDLLEKIGNV